jgi:mono/diheme cytochrome c family protein
VVIIGVGIVALGMAGGVWWWTSLPRSPEELFAVRCAACHELPDLSAFAPNEIALLVDFMRRQKGASRHIDDEEALQIIAYLEERAERRLKSDNRQVRGQ